MRPERLIVVACLLALAACSKKSERAEGGPPPPERSAVSAEPEPETSDAARSQRWYRAVLDGEYGQVPFFLELSDGAEGPATIANGSERLPALASWKGERLTLRFPDFSGYIEAERSEDGVLAGSWILPPSLPGKLSFRADPVDTPDAALRFPPVPEMGFAGPAAVDMTGAWEIEADDFDGGYVEFKQGADGTVSGVILLTNQGDVGEHVGSLRGRTLRASNFDGDMAFEFRFEVDESGNRATGAYIFPGIFSLPFTARRVADFDKARLSTAALAQGKTTISLPELSLPDYAGHPVIVDFTGTWCRVCRYSVPFLKEMYERYHKEGLEILTIAFEMSGDAEVDARVVQDFVEAHQIPWRTIARSTSHEEVSALLPEELINTGSFPLLVFVDRKGTVRKVHSGFNSRSSSVDYERVTTLLAAATAAIVAP